MSSPHARDNRKKYFLPGLVHNLFHPAATPVFSDASLIGRKFNGTTVSCKYKFLQNKDKKTRDGHHVPRVSSHLKNRIIIINKKTNRNKENTYLSKQNYKRKFS